MEVKSINFSMKLKINFSKDKSDWQQARQLISNFQKQDRINSHGDGGVEINSVFDYIENQYQQLQEKLAADPNVLQLIARWR
jgi:hypothetical protein